MKSRIIPLLRCPSSGKKLHVFAVELYRRGRLLKYLHEEDIQESDEITRGVLACENSKQAYLIRDSIATLLTFDDMDPESEAIELNSFEYQLPEFFRSAISETASRLRAGLTQSSAGKWKQGEIKYFDKDVATENLRREFAHKIQNEALWHRYLPRDRHIIQKINEGIEGKFVLEIGCGNSRTIA